MKELIVKTREHFAEIERKCIEEAISGKVRVNDLPRYIEWCEQNIVDHLAGKNDHTFTFRQYAHWLKTGDCVPFL
jgi:hypothetical protein